MFDSHKCKGKCMLKARKNFKKKSGQNCAEGAKKNSGPSL